MIHSGDFVGGYAKLLRDEGDNAIPNAARGRTVVDSCRCFDVQEPEKAAAVRAGRVSD